jgi:hypothetical protein
VSHPPAQRLGTTPFPSEAPSVIETSAVIMSSDRGRPVRMIVGVKRLANIPQRTLRPRVTGMQHAAVCPEGGTYPIGAT